MSLPTLSALSVCTTGTKFGDAKFKDDDKRRRSNILKQKTREAEAKQIAREAEASRGVDKPSTPVAGSPSERASAGAPKPPPTQLPSHTPKPASPPLPSPTPSVESDSEPESIYADPEAWRRIYACMQAKKQAKKQQEADKCELHAARLAAANAESQKPLVQQKEQQERRLSELAMLREVDKKKRTLEREQGVA